jgi:deazaflavin-dependent oxidoreductase (nitroreductase family)
MSNQELKSLLDELSKEAYCYFTTKGRNSGNPHEIEIWFGVDGNTLHLLSGGRERSDWVKNLLKDPNVTVRIGKHTFGGTACIVNDEKEDAMARAMLADKYSERNNDGSLSNWARTALAVRIDLETVVS